jgi:hypothetical protein
VLTIPDEKIGFKRSTLKCGAGSGGGGGKEIGLDGGIGVAKPSLNLRPEEGGGTLST